MADEGCPRQWVRCATRPRLHRVGLREALNGITAPAKINVGLAVTGRRTDGYHKIVTLMAPLALADTVRVEPAPDFSLVCDDPALATDDNLALRAARAFHAAMGERRGARITLTKRIPIAAGLGGGSSDAAATLIALDALRSTTTPDAVLLAVARALGADVPFLLYRGAMLAQGIGDLLLPVPFPRTWLVLVTPRLAIPGKTAVLYRQLTEADYGDGLAIRGQAKALRSGRPFDPSLLANAFLAPLERIAPVIGETRRAMEATGARAFLSGSGPTLYTLCTDEAEAERRAARFRAALDATVIVTHTGMNGIPLPPTPFPIGKG